MKRSEMLDHLEDLIDSTQNIDVPNYAYLKVAALAEEILVLIENKGMMPPSTNSSMLIDNQNYCPNYVLRQCIWEPEDV